MDGIICRLWALFNFKIKIVKLLQFRVTKQFLLLVILLSLFSCTFTTIKPKEPHFIADPGSISADIGRLIAAEQVGFTGSELKTNGQATSELSVTLVNAKNPPKDQDQYGELGEQIAQLLKHSLKDPNEYDTYKVIFLIEQTKGAVTKSRSAEFSYPSAKL